MKMKALKSFSYNTRRLVPGEDFETKRDIDARLLEANKRAERVREIGELPPPPKAIVAKVADAAEAVKALRAEYTRLVGKKPYNGWGADELRAKIAAANA